MMLLSPSLSFKLLFLFLFLSFCSFSSARSSLSRRQQDSPSVNNIPSASPTNSPSTVSETERTPSPSSAGDTPSTTTASPRDWSTLVIKLKDGHSFSNMSAFQIRRKFLQNGVFSLKGNRRNVQRLKKLLEKDEDIETVKYDKLHYLRKVPIISTSPPMDREDPSEVTEVKTKRNGMSVGLSELLSDLGVNPMFDSQWHLRNTGQAGGTQGEDVRAIDTFVTGFTGKGVTVAVLDDGVEWSHPDFSGKVNLDISFDYLDDVSDPSPKSDTDRHGTSVAGLIAGADNDVCGVGVAMNAQLAVFRAVGSVPITNSELADAFLTHSDVIDVYSNSWGNGEIYLDIDDNVQPISDVLRRTAKTGRKGKGGVILFAAGNDRSTFRTTNEDVYTTSPYTIVVGASHDGGQVTSYSTPGSSVFLCAPSGDDGRSHLFTTDRSGSRGYDASGNCFSGFSGTSGATPIAAGVVALVLEANPNLTSRDVLHILSLSSDVIDKSNTEWQINGGGRYVSHLVGFGRINSLAATRLAINWPTVPAKEELSINGAQTNVKLPPSSQTDVVYLTLDVPTDLFIEHVQVFVNISHQSRGDLSITLISPFGTQSYLKISKRADATPNLVWTFMSTQHWGESSQGKWTLVIRDTFSYMYTGSLNNWRMIFHGMNRDVVPSHVIRNSPQSNGAVTSSNSTCQTSSTKPTCVNSEITKCVCQKDTYCCLIKWDSTCVKNVKNFGCMPSASSTPAPTPLPTSVPTPAPTPSVLVTPSPSSSLQPQSMVKQTTCALTLFRSSNVTCTVSDPQQITTGRVATVFGDTNMCTIDLYDSQGPVILNYGYVDSKLDTWNVIVFVEIAQKKIASLTSSAFRKQSAQKVFNSGQLTDWKLSNGVLSRENSFLACFG
eukprot:TRINITY_DN3107_c0_g3_i1.p1 TRINITY_DN3107_c0_g3~~TRINITY_DN3107_c0_g3_i1.p1  ORF type:complete len:888 (-),score=224.87 TRINITY_DN3107_c0_g3_i1:700-3363(-)